MIIIKKGKWAIMSNKTLFLILDDQLDKVDFAIIKFVMSLKGYKLITRPEAVARGLIQ